MVMWHYAYHNNAVRNNPLLLLLPRPPGCIVLSKFLHLILADRTESAIAVLA